MFTVGGAVASLHPGGCPGGGGGDKDTHELSLETLCMVQETRTGRVNYVHNNNNMLAVF